MAVALEVEAVSKTYRIPVLAEVSFAVAKGDFTCLLGPNGCGKTTLLRIISGLERPSSGRVLIAQQPLHAGAWDAHRIGVVFQEDRLLPWLTLAENVALVLRPLGLSKRERRRLAREFLAFVGLRGFEDYYPNRVSGGMKQRAAIARALAIEPEILLMDEPFAALDAQNRRLMQQEVQRIWEKTGKTVLFITHSIEEAIVLGTKLVLLSARPATVRAVIANHGGSDPVALSQQLHALIAEEVQRQRLQEGEELLVPGVQHDDHQRNQNR